MTWQSGSGGVCRRSQRSLRRPHSAAAPSFQHLQRHLWTRIRLDQRRTLSDNSAPCPVPVPLARHVCALSPRPVGNARHPLNHLVRNPVRPRNLAQGPQLKVPVSTHLALDHTKGAREGERLARFGVPRSFAQSQPFRTASTDHDSRAAAECRTAYCSNCACPRSQVASEAAFLLRGLFGVKSCERVHATLAGPGRQSVD